MPIDKLFDCDCEKKNLVCKVVFDTDVVYSTGMTTVDFNVIPEATGCGIHQPAGAEDKLSIHPNQVTLCPYSNR